MSHQSDQVKKVKRTKRKIKVKKKKKRSVLVVGLYGPSAHREGKLPLKTLIGKHSSQLARMEGSIRSVGIRSL